MERNEANRLRYQPSSSAGHYESYFQRANHSSRPLAFWIRYTIFSPRGRPDDAVGELWAIYFDGETGKIAAVKEQFPIAQCRFAFEGLDMQIGAATLDGAGLIGGAESGGHRIGWNLSYRANTSPLFLLDRKLYDAGLPKAKALVGTPLATYSGIISVDGAELPIDEWVGSQNHNWGSKHTDQYAWGQVAGFENAPDVFLECSTARIKIGPVSSPWMTLVVLRVDQEEYALNTLRQAIRAKGSFEYLKYSSPFLWDFESERDGVRIKAHFYADRSKFVGLRYDNPPGGSKTCLNTKIARASVELECEGQPRRVFHTENRAAFEILTDATDHGVSVV